MKKDPSLLFFAFQGLSIMMRLPIASTSTSRPRISGFPRPRRLSADGVRISFRTCRTGLLVLSRPSTRLGVARWTPRGPLLAVPLSEPLLALVVARVIIFPRVRQPIPGTGAVAPPLVVRPLPPWSPPPTRKSPKDVRDHSAISSPCKVLLATLLASRVRPLLEDRAPPV